MKLFGHHKKSGTSSADLRASAWSWVQPTVSYCSRGLWRVRRTILIATLVYAVVLLLFLPLLCANLPYCKLYRSRHGDFSNALGYNTQRYESADRFIKGLGTDTKRQYERHGMLCCPRFAIGVITTRRGRSFSDSDVDGGPSRSSQPNYLTQVMAQLHRSLEAENATSKTALFMCNVDIYHQKHTEFHELAHLFPHRTRYEDEKVYPFVETYEKEKSDYKYCLREALRYNPEYVILLQDDAYPRSDFFPILEHVLRTRLESPVRAGEPVPPEDDWLWVKLNFPDNLSFFERNWYFALEWVALAVFISGSFTLALHVCKLCRTDRIDASSTSDAEDAGGPGHGSHYRHQSGWHWLNLVFLLSFALVFLSLLALERPYFTRWRAISKYLYTLGPGTSCCLPAVLYPARQVPYIVGYLQHIKCHSRFPLDFALEEYRLRRGLRQYLVSPNLFRHIGMYSSLRRMYNSREASKYLFLE